MIFNKDVVTEGVGLACDITFEDTLMQVYENECNYNTLMKAVGISELRYYNDTGKELFVEDAGAFSKFIDSAKKFFQKIIDGIKGLFNKFMAFIRSKLSDNKTFLKKYKSELTSKDLSGFKFKGYQFEKIEWRPDEANIPDLTKGGNDVDDDGRGFVSDHSNDPSDYLDQNRAEIAGSLTTASKLSKAEFIKLLKENLVGKEKKEFTVDINKEIEILENARLEISLAKSNQDYICNIIKTYIKTLESNRKTYVAATDDKGEDKSKYLKNINKDIALMKSSSNDYNIAYGQIISALKTQNAQAKAICAKALSYKKDSSSSSSDETKNESTISSLFANVII